MRAKFEFDSIEEMQEFFSAIGKEVNNMSEEQAGLEDLAEEGVARKEEAAAGEPTLEDPVRSTGTGADSGSRRDPDALSHTSVEEAARSQAKPLDPATGVDDTRVEDDTADDTDEDE